MLTSLLALAFATPILRGHAHNDYAHPRPLLDALDNGFTSVEADVFLVDGDLRVAHDRKDIRPDRTLRKLYLDPLKARARNGSVFDPPTELWLLVDIKADGAAVYATLKKQLANYRSMLTRYEAGAVVPGAVRVVLSGDRPVERVAQESKRLVFLDGRLSELGSTNAGLYPLISDSWPSKLRWNGWGAMPEEERRQIGEWAQQAHERGQRLRLWAAPDTEPSWRAQFDAGVDFINTDKLSEFATWLKGVR